MQEKSDQTGYKNAELDYITNGQKNAQMIFDKFIWGVDEVCSFTQYAKGTIYNLVSKGEIPHRRRGSKRKLVFVPSEIIAWLKGERT